MCVWLYKVNLTIWKSSMKLDLQHRFLYLVLISGYFKTSFHIITFSLGFWWLNVKIVFQYRQMQRWLLCQPVRKSEKFRCFRRLFSDAFPKHFQSGSFQHPRSELFRLQPPRSGREDTSFRPNVPLHSDSKGLQMTFNGNVLCTWRS